MPKVSRNTASHSVELEGIDVQLDHLDGGYSVCFEKHTADAELDAFRGLPGDRCPLPRWGYVFNGKVSFVFPDHKETFEAGDAYYVPPGHRAREAWLAGDRRGSRRESIASCA
jgi:hypothetical protein